MIKQSKITLSKRPSWQRLVLVALSTAAVILILGLILQVGASINEQLTGNTAANIRNTARIDRLEFCVNFSISPCNDETLHQWNQTHTQSWEQYSNFSTSDSAK